ncbi:dihydrolipoyl dehydrogenase [Alkalicoccus urumqiensis]|uniref:Dihydrolipoyl dehydrogenase n=1 Tax=Alkalicoccus urumqiensis TaxID=1548213 RepID=A0A2P6ME11_ALKUR|nr:dihydrolipoyl dehydrogenase [Alkalicoccus urumqiensis]PRO64523.1 dihydrolipoyl dehydrogenase [Alkalicoccus urumqiensis]
MVVGEVAVETDVVVIGGGPGGYAAAIRLGQLGKSVVLVEKEALGGACLHRGCIPSKALIHTAETMEKAAHASTMGIRGLEKAPALDMGAWQEWKQSVVQTLEQGVEGLCRRQQVTIVRGKASFFSDDRIGVETDGDMEYYRFQEAVIATGSSPVHPGFAPVDHRRVLDSTSLLSLEELPASLAVIGGGYIGVELGSALAKAGTDVTLIEAAPEILPAAAPHLSRVVAKKADKQMTVLTGASLSSLTAEADGVSLSVETTEETIEKQVDYVLVTVGRKPNTDGLGLSQAGVEVEENGMIPVDMQCRTNVSHIYAIGDITPGPALAHKASKQGKVAAEVIGGMNRAVDSAFIPYVIFSDPQIAGVGRTKEEAEADGYNVKTGRFPMQHNGYALASEQAEGFAEVVVDADSHVLLGFHAVGPDAVNTISEGALALELAARVEDVAWTVHPHPTLSEGWMEACEQALGHAIHVPS